MFWSQPSFWSCPSASAYSSAGSLQLGAISLSGLAVGSIVGIVLNAIMPGKDYVYGEDKQGDESVNFIVQ